MSSQGTVHGRLALAAEPAREPADVDQMWRAAGAAAALIGLAGGGGDLLVGTLAESVAASAVLADGVMGCLALLESENVAPGADGARRIYGGVLRWRNGGGYDRSDDVDHMRDAAEQVAARLRGGPGAGEAAMGILDDWRRAG